MDWSLANTVLGIVQTALLVLLIAIVKGWKLPHRQSSAPVEVAPQIEVPIEPVPAPAIIRPKFAIGDRVIVRHEARMGGACGKVTGLQESGLVYLDLDGTEAKFIAYHEEELIKISEGE